jgi:hypothetical protein
MVIRRTSVRIAAVSITGECRFTNYRTLMRGLRAIPLSPKNISRQPLNGKPLRFADYKVVELGRRGFEK